MLSNTIIASLVVIVPKEGFSCSSCAKLHFYNLKQNTKQLISHKLTLHITNMKIILIIIFKSNQLTT